MNPITILLIVIVALLAGMEGILDEFQFHQPLVPARSSAWSPATWQEASSWAAPSR